MITTVHVRKFCRFRTVLYLRSSFYKGLGFYYVASANGILHLDETIFAVIDHPSQCRYSSNTYMPSDVKMSAVLRIFHLRVQCFNNSLDFQFPSISDQNNDNFL